MILSKEKFVELMEFIQQQRQLEEKLSQVLTKMSPGFHCDTYVYAEYETKLLKLIQDVMNDKYDNIGYRMYEYALLTPAEQSAQLVETPELASWETLYDYLVEK